MASVTTTDFFTHCCTSLQRSLARWLLAWAWVTLGAFAGPAWAASAGGNDAAQAGEVSELRLERTDEGLYLSAGLQFALPELAEDALYKGIPMFFVAEAQVLRDRWYWSDRQVAEATRYLRLSYQPLTRRWRLNISPVPFTNTGLGVVLGQNFDDLSDALSAMQRVVRWKIADGGVIEPDAAHTVNFRFRLDMSQLPRPFQIGAVGRTGWSLLVSRSQRLMPER